MSNGKPNALKRAKLFAKFAKTEVQTIAVRSAPNEESPSDTLDKDDLIGGLYVGSLNNIELTAPIGPFSLFFNDNTMDDLWFAITWSGAG